MKSCFLSRPFEFDKMKKRIKLISRSAFNICSLNYDKYDEYIYVLISSNENKIQISGFDAIRTFKLRLCSVTFGRSE